MMRHLLTRFPAFVSITLLVIVSIFMTTVLPGTSQVIKAQGPQDCPLEETDHWVGQSVPPAPEYLDLDGDKQITKGGDWFTCAIRRQGYYEYCGYHSPTDAQTKPCQQVQRGVTGKPSDALYPSAQERENGGVSASIICHLFGRGGNVRLL